MSKHRHSTAKVNRDKDCISLGEAAANVVRRAGIQMRLRKVSSPLIPQIDAIWDDATLSGRQQEQAVDALLRKEGLQ